jgi:hypothetical protein
MFARFHQTPSRLQVSLRESRRIDGKPRCEHIASLGSIPEPMTTADRVAFWARLYQRLTKLSNRIGAEDQEKIIGNVHARIPMVTIDDMRAAPHAARMRADRRHARGRAAEGGDRAVRVRFGKHLAALFGQGAGAAALGRAGQPGRMLGRGGAGPLRSW